jgi:hypothetical protein
VRAAAAILSALWLALASAPAFAQAWNLYATPFLAPGLTTTIVDVKGVQGSLQWYACSNANATVAFVQAFDAASSTGITLGTTAPRMSLPVQPSGVTVALVPTNFLKGIQVAATTTVKGSAAPATALDCSFGFE